MNNRGQEDPQPGPSGMQPAKSKANKGKAKRKRNQDEEEDDKEEDMEDGDIRGQVKLSRIHNRDRNWVKKMPASFGSSVPAFQQKPLKTLPGNCKCPLDFFKLIVDNDYIEGVAANSKLYAVRKNHPDVVDKLTVGNIRTSQAVMFLTGYLSPSNRRMFWEMKEDTQNSFIKKAISRTTFRDVITYTYFVGARRTRTPGNPYSL
jgi:hypothetical protein